MLSTIFSRRLILSLSLFEFFAFAGQGLATTFIQRDIPAVTGQTCEAFADAEGERFGGFMQENNIDVEDVSARCIDGLLGRNTHTWNVEITYRSAQPLNEISTDYPSRTVVPGYSSQAACSSALPNQLSLFENQTGLKAFTKYCRAPVYSGEAWTINVTGFGSPRVRPYSTSALLSGLPVNFSSETFVNMIKTQLSEIEGVLSHLIVTGRPVNRKIMIRYYSPTKMTLAERPLAKYNVANQCLAEVSEGAAALKAADILNFGTYCQKLDIGGRFELVTLNDVGRDLNMTHHSVSFPNFGDCASNKQNILAYYRDELNRDIKGGFCTYDQMNRIYKLRLLEK